MYDFLDRIAWNQQFNKLRMLVPGDISQIWLVSSFTLLAVHISRMNRIGTWVTMFVVFLMIWPRVNTLNSYTVLEWLISTDPQWNGYKWFLPIRTSSNFKARNCDCLHLAPQIIPRKPWIGQLTRANQLVECNQLVVWGIEFYHVTGRIAPHVVIIAAVLLVLLVASSAASGLTAIVGYWPL